MMFQNKSKHQIQSTNSSRNNLRIMRMTIAVLTIFIICEFPTFLERLYYKLQITRDLFTIGDLNDKDTTMVFRKIAQGFTVIDSSANFIVYCLTNGNFRKTVRNTFLSNNKSNM